MKGPIKECGVWGKERTSELIRLNGFSHEPITFCSKMLSSGIVNGAFCCFFCFIWLSICWKCNKIAKILVSKIQICKDAFHVSPCSFSSPDSVEDELELSAVRHRPEGLEQLEAQTRFSRKELQILYRGFKNVSDEATIHNVHLGMLCSFLDISFFFTSKTLFSFWFYFMYSFTTCCSEQGCFHPSLLKQLNLH